MNLTVFAVKMVFMVLGQLDYIFSDNDVNALPLNLLDRELWRLSFVKSLVVLIQFLFAFFFSLLLPGQKRG